MGKLITIIGNSGAGKTTLTHLLCETWGYRYTAFLEQHAERPFQQNFQQDLTKNSLANQIDYMLYRAEQELYIRNSDLIGVQDGGLDQDFYVFTRLFYSKGYLRQSEFELCQRFYTLTRQVQPYPDVIILLNASVDILRERRSQRARKLDIAQQDDLLEMDRLIQDWTRQKPFSDTIIHMDVSQEDVDFSNSLQRLSQIIEKSLPEANHPNN
ncbi:MAG: deoxynucleoside kinase [Anaerolineaceae bacterium]|nr:deoxynucleoside kinase [Anaerolineaceae bacterium]